MTSEETQCLNPLIKIAIPVKKTDKPNGKDVVTYYWCADTHDNLNVLKKNTSMSFSLLPSLIRPDSHAFLKSKMMQ